MIPGYLKNLFISQSYDPHQFFLIAGPCVVEDEAMVKEVAASVSELCKKYKIPFVFKASYRKANRSSMDSFAGIGDAVALSIIKKVADEYNIPVTTDIHSAQEASLAAPYVDILQIPAFLSRQTDLLRAAAATGKIVNVKKGQFLSPESMRFAVDKIRRSGNDQIMLTDRGTCFGYQDLIVDFRSIPIMQENHCPVIMDCTHSLQQPNQLGGVTGGNPSLIGTIASSAIASGADGIFIETHPDPARALSDGANMLPLRLLESLLKRLSAIRLAVEPFLN